MRITTIVLLLTAGFGITLAMWLYRYMAIDQSPLAYGERVSSEQSNPNTTVSIRIEEVVGGLEVPWSIVWTSPTRMLVAERPGRLRVVEHGVLRTEPLLTFPVSSGGEEGLMGLAVDPNYSANRFLYACYAYTTNGAMVNRVVRIVDRGTQAHVDRTLIDHIPSARYHAGCGIAFGPDRTLYITTGDAGERALAQQLNSFAGKILRIQSDGTIPPDNPFAPSPVWSFGHRNPQGIAFHPVTGMLYATEHGPSVIDGPAGGDEVNRIVRGGNYGWPLVSHEQRRDGTIHPLIVFTPAEAPASAAFYSGARIPQWKQSFFFGALKGEGLIRMVFDSANPDKVIAYEKLHEVHYGRIRAVAEGPDGFLYFSTSNRDGRGDPAPNDDRIFRIIPNEGTPHPTQH